MQEDINGDIKGEKQVRYLLAHEKTHIRHKDNLWRMLAILICCMHWFNPLAWITLRYFFADMELACDERTVRNFYEKERLDYVETLLAFTRRKTTMYAVAFGGGNVKARIKSVLAYRRFSIVALSVFIVIFAIMAIVVLSNK